MLRCTTSVRTAKPCALLLWPNSHTDRSSSSSSSSSSPAATRPALPLLIRTQAPRTAQRWSPAPRASVPRPQHPLLRSPPWCAATLFSSSPRHTPLTSPLLPRPATLSLAPTRTLTTSFALGATTPNSSSNTAADSPPAARPAPPRPTVMPTFSDKRWLRLFTSGRHDPRQATLREARRRGAEKLRQDVAASLAEWQALQRQSHATLSSSGEGGGKDGDGKAFDGAAATPAGGEVEAGAAARVRLGGSLALVRVSAVQAANALVKLGDYLAEISEFAEGAEHYEAALAIALQLNDAGAAVTARHGLATCLHNLGRAEEALAAWRANHDVLQGPAGAALPASELQKKLAGTNRGLGATLLLLRRPAEALGHLVRAMKAYVGLYGPRAPPLMDVFEFAGLAHWAMAAACNAAAAGSAGGLSVAALVGGGSAGGGAALEEEVRRSLNEALVGEAAGALGPDAWSDGPKNVEAALVYLDNAVELRREHQNTDWPEFLVCERNCAELLMSLGQPDEAELRWRLLQAVMRVHYGPSHALTVAAMAGYAHSLPPTSVYAREAYVAALKQVRAGDDVDASRASDQRGESQGYLDGEREALERQLLAGQADAEAGLTLRGGPWGEVATLQPLTLAPQTQSF